jgi:hypothetical protein
MNEHADNVRLLVCGDRNWTDYKAVVREIAARRVSVVIEGEAKGADRFARLAAERLEIPVLPFPADWEQYGREAGPIRNRQMLQEGKPTEVIAFHADIASSKGTANMVALARKAGIPVTVYDK